MKKGLNVSVAAAAAAAKQLLLIFYILLASYFWLNASNPVKQPTTFYRYILFSCAQLYLHLFCFPNECILSGVIYCSRFAT